LSFCTFFARSEGCRHGLKPTHNPKVAGSNPAPATNDDEGLKDAAAANPFRLPRLHPGIGLALTSRTKVGPKPISMTGGRVVATYG